jgi:hypothetical protein
MSTSAKIHLRPDPSSRRSIDFWKMDTLQVILDQSLRLHSRAALDDTKSDWVWLIGTVGNAHVGFHCALQPLSSDGELATIQVALPLGLVWGIFLKFDSREDLTTEKERVCRFLQSHQSLWLDQRRDLPFFVVCSEYCSDCAHSAYQITRFDALITALSLESCELKFGTVSAEPELIFSLSVSASWVASDEQTARKRLLQMASELRDPSALVLVEAGSGQPPTLLDMDTDFDADTSSRSTSCGTVAKESGVVTVARDKFRGCYVPAKKKMGSTPRVRAVVVLSDCSSVDSLTSNPTPKMTILDLNNSNRVIEPAVIQVRASRLAYAKGEDDAKAVFAALREALALQVVSIATQLQIAFSLLLPTAGNSIDSLNSRPGEAYIKNKKLAFAARHFVVTPNLHVTLGAFSRIMAAPFPQPLIDGDEARSCEYQLEMRRRWHVRLGTRNNTTIPTNTTANVDDRT